jgi:hypothetical protein
MTGLLRKTKPAIFALSVIVILCGLATAQNEEKQHQGQPTVPKQDRAPSLPIQPPDPMLQLPEVHIDDAVFAEALLSFHKLANATEIGISYIDYKRLLLDAKTDFDIPIAKFPKSVQRTGLEEAMRDFILAGDVWSVSIESAVWCTNQYQPIGVPMKTDFYRGLRARIGEDILPAPKFGRCAKQDAVVKIMWLSAAKRIAHAAELQKDAR